MTMIIYLREWLNVSSDIDNNIELNPIDQFIYDNEPAGVIDDAWRKSLEEMLEFVIEETQDGRLP